MAWQNNIFTIPGLQAAGDLSSDQFKCVKKNTTDKQVALCDTDGEVLLGVLQNKPDASGKAAEVAALGVVRVEAGETLTAGDAWGTDASGTAKKIEGTVTGADVGDYAAGEVLIGAASGELAVCTIGLSTFKVEAQ